jgi:hypothetical protein
MGKLRKSGFTRMPFVINPKAGSPKFEKTEAGNAGIRKSHSKYRETEAKNVEIRKQQLLKKPSSDLVINSFRFLL